MSPKPGQKVALITGYVEVGIEGRGCFDCELTRDRCTPGGIGHALALRFHERGRLPRYPIRTKQPPPLAQVNSSRTRLPENRVKIGPDVTGR